ncbi:acetyl-CoA carboxylase biotin carboxyl carrier protein [Mycoplasmatota bacterium]|nr:acetyl-CoA carboxylase biotin carboxyl carrier protein [Mycoplasmatota bacterium]
MDFRQIQNIIKDFESSNITNLEIEMDNFKIKLNKNNLQEVEVSPIQVVKSNNHQEKKVEITDETEIYQVKSPLVGTFYGANSPKDEPFVKIGQKVNKGDTLCIIEAMKIMNEISAPTSGVIESINIKNGEPVGFDEVIMTIR